jgi:GAF domain-containing protein
MCGKTRHKYLCNDVSSDPNYTNLSLPILTQSELCLPILKGNEIVAVLNIESDRRNAFDEDDLITLEAVASQIAVAITNQRLYHEATRFNKKLQQAVDEKTLELRRAHERILEQQLLLKRKIKLKSHCGSKQQIHGNHRPLVPAYFQFSPWWRKSLPP